MERYCTRCGFESIVLSCRPGIPFWSRLADVAVQFGGQSVLTPLMRDIPTATPIALMIGFQAVKMQYGTLQADKVVRTPWAIHYRDAIDIMRVYDIEFAFPTDIKHPVLAVKAVRKVIEITEKYAYEGKLAWSASSWLQFLVFFYTQDDIL